MEKRTAWIYITILIAGIFAAFLSEMFVGSDLYNRTELEPAQMWNAYMEESMEAGSYVYRTTLPDKDIAGKVIGYDTAHMRLFVTIDGEQVYSLKPVDGSFMHTTGYHWNFISLRSGDEGKEIVFRVTPVYADSAPKGNFYFGEGRAVEHLIIHKYAARFGISIMILLVGIVLFLYILVVMKNMQDSKMLLHLTFLATILGIWSACESQMLELIFPWHVGLVLLDHLTLMLLPIPFLLFLRAMYQCSGHFLWDIGCYVNCAIVIVRILMQAAGIFDLRETLVLTHIAIGLTIFLITGLSVYEIAANRMSRQAKISIFCVLGIMGCVLLELVLYRFFNISLSLGSVGFLAYIVVMGLFIVSNSRRMMMKARESELYRRLAFSDGLTGLYNRTAFNRDLEQRGTSDNAAVEYRILPTALYIFDLNDLKKCNDGYGHEYGDNYIKMVADVIRRVFQDGSCYRIGGDEFCVISNMEPEEVRTRYKAFMEEIQKINEQAFVVPVSVAVGYAVYDPKVDVSLEAAVKRADEMMYRNKQQSKVEPGAI